MKSNFKINFTVLLIMALVYSCCKDTPSKKPCDNCKPRTHCEKDSCVLDKGYFYSNADGTGEIISIFPANYSLFNECHYTNFSYRDTPWLTPRDLLFYKYGGEWTAGGKALEIYFGRNDYTSYSFNYIPPIFYRDGNGKIKRVILFQTNDDSQVRLMPNDSMLPYGKTRTIWDGVVSDDYKEINFTVKFIQPEFGAQGGKWNDTFKVIKNYIMTKDPTNRANCTFCE